MKWEESPTDFAKQVKEGSWMMGDCEVYRQTQPLTKW
jgi:hypothetical protein